MLGRKQKHYMFGYPQKLPEGQLPTHFDIINFSLFLKRDKVATGEWKNNVDKLTVAKEVICPIVSVWEKLEIPHQFSYMSEYVIQKVVNILKVGSDLMKVPISRRSNCHGDHLKIIFDIAACQCKDKQCNCTLDKKVPDLIKTFLSDQRGDRKLHLSDLPSLENEEQARKIMRKVGSRNRLERQKIDWEDEKAATMSVSDDSVLDEIIGPEGDTNMDDGDSDSDWEEIRDSDESSEKRKYNNCDLTRFVRELDRYKTSYRAGAAIGNALLKDYRKLLDISKKDLPNYFLDPAKIRREKNKEGKKAEKEQKKQETRGIYFDGKKSLALTEVTTFLGDI